MDKRELLIASLDKQYLFAKGAKRDIVSNLCGLQAQFANNPSHALRIRAHDYGVGGCNDGLVKTWTFRRTLHAVRRDEIALYLSAQGIAGEWDDSWRLDRGLKPRRSKLLHKWIRQGVCARDELRRKCRENGMPPAVEENVFHGWGGLMSEMCSRGMIAYEAGTLKRFVSCGDFRPMERDPARAEILRRYFTHLGPATIRDCAAWTGYGVKAVREILEKFPPQTDRRPRLPPVRGRHQGGELRRVGVCPKISAPSSLRIRL